MRRHIFLLILLCLHGLARGQTGAYSGYYWFDNQQGKAQTSPLVQGSFDVDASALADGIHSFHYMVIESDTAVSSPVFRYFLKSTGAASSGQVTCLCMVDGNLVYNEILPATGGAIHWDLDVNSINEGLHTLQIQALMGNGALSGSYSNYFVKTSNADTAIKGFYWFDDETFIREAPVTNGTFEVDASALSDGFHKFHYQASQGSGVTSLPTSNYFLKTAQVNSDDVLNCICTVDGQLRHIEKLSQQGGVIHWDLDMQDLADGMHQIQLQAVTLSGALSSTYTSYFMRIVSYEDLSQMYCVYAIDGNSLNSRSNVVSQHGSFHFDLDLSELEEGLHYISFMLHNDRGSSTKAQTRFFVKTPLGGNGIMQYQYWLNEDSLEQAKTVTLPEKVNPLQLMTLLPVESRPLRSSLFHFDTSSGKPMIYAKNTIHLRFYDVALRFSDVAKDYADYSIGQEVNVIKALESGVRETTGWPGENEIKWYQVTAERGERLIFKLDHAATLQVFSPSGKEVHKVYGAESVVWDGFNAEENGIFYVALHDVTATQGEAINIDYEHIDRYAVLRQDVAVVGNSGYSTITFEGNGYDELTSVELIQGSNVITSVEIGHESNATTGVKFDFSDATLGEYKAVFHFEEGELTIEKCITIEEFIKPVLSLSASFAKTFKGTTNTYDFTIVNRGNATAYEVPIAIYIFGRDSTFLDGVNIQGVNMRKSIETILGDNYTDSLSLYFDKAEKVYGDKTYFIRCDSSDYIKDFPYLYWTVITPNIKSGRNRNKINVTIRLHDYLWSLHDKVTLMQAHVYLAIPSEYATIAHDAIMAVKRKDASTSWWQRFKDWIYNYFDPKKVTDEYAAKNTKPLPDPEAWKTMQELEGGLSINGLATDPNDIYGYLSDAGSKFIASDVEKVNYTIEFENDPELATAAAHEIFVTDTLDATKFDLSTFAPAQVNIGNRSIELNGEKNFIKTVDMRPEINAIAQVTGEYNQAKGIAKWHITSLDPMTMEQTNDVMQGILPVNYDGKSGIGGITFNISRKVGLPDGAEINNRASIIFDKNEAILTPTWTNIVDAVAPNSVIDNSWMVNDSTLRITADAFDERSGVWKYTWYVQAGENAPWWNEGETEGPQFDYHIFEGIDYGFCVLATDSAGNVEQKVIERERSFKTYGPDYEDGIDSLTPDPSPEGEGSWYDLSGRRLAVPRRGINVIDDKKVLVK